MCSQHGALQASVQLLREVQTAVQKHVQIVRPAQISKLLFSMLLSKSCTIYVTAQDVILGMSGVRKPDSLIIIIIGTRIEAYP